MEKVKWISLSNGWILLESIRFGQSRRRTWLCLQLKLLAQWIKKVQLCKKKKRKKKKAKEKYFLRDTPQGHTIFCHAHLKMNTHTQTHTLSAAQYWSPLVQWAPDSSQALSAALTCTWRQLFQLLSFPPMKTGFLLLGQSEGSAQVTFMKGWT